MNVANDLFRMGDPVKHRIGKNGVKRFILAEIVRVDKKKRNVGVFLHGLMNHFSGGVYPGHLRSVTGDFGCEIARAATEVEDGFLRPGLKQFHQGFAQRGDKG
jgi:hypothetical protein